MANLRILHNNLADTATVTATGTLSALPATNLQSDGKSAVWRSTGLASVAVALEWATPQTVSMVALAFTNLTTASTIRVRCYTLPADVTPVVDVTVNAVKGSASIFDVPHSAGGNSYAAVYFPSGSFRRVHLSFTDAANPAGYMQAARMMVGSYWSPVYNVEWGAVTMGLIDTGKSERTEAGDLRTDRGNVHKTLSFDLNYMPTTDLAVLYNILRTNGTFRPMFVSVTPEDADSGDEEQVMQIYGKLSRLGAIKLQFMNQYSTQLDLEEM